MTDGLSTDVTERGPTWSASAAKLPALRSAWERSQATISRLRRELAATALPSEIATVVASGSVGRLEQITSSDADLIVVANAAELSLSRRRELVSRTWDAIAHLALPRPDPNGIFGEAVTITELTSVASLSEIDEAIPVYGKRIQLLLDCQPVFGNDCFWEVQRDVLARYGAGDVMLDKMSEWTCLINELIRYYRCMAIDAQWKPRSQRAHQRFMIKFLHSRRLLYISLLMLLGESSCDQGDRFEWVCERLVLTPLERIEAVTSAHDAGPATQPGATQPGATQPGATQPGATQPGATQPNASTASQFAEVLRFYDSFLRRMDDPLLSAEESASEQLDDVVNELYENGRGLANVLATCLGNCSKSWSPAMQQLLML